jgi:alkylation response protein AidB-like acyl-CoA dehydrogenase
MYTMPAVALHGRMTISVAERAELRSAVRDLLSSEAPGEFDRTLWHKLAAQGVAGLLVGTEYGGVGLGAQELEAVAEETGAALLPAPFLASAVLTVALIEAAGTEQDRRRLLPGLADGTRIGTVALTGATGTWSPGGVAVRADGDTLHGTAHYVLHGQVADVLLVVARIGHDFGVFEVTPDAPGLQRTAATVFDPSTPLSTFSFDGVPGRRLGAAGWDAVQRALDLAVIALAGEQAGGARRIFEITVDYLKTRIQFGRPIGSFQALKHMAADLLLEVESATSAAQHAAARFGTENADAAIALAGFTCAQVYHTTAMQAIQMHGGIGFTWEHPAHRYLRRARTGVPLFGSPAQFRERYLVAKGA